MRDAGVAGVAAAGALSSPARALGAVRRAGARQTVAVFGGGISGLTAAHELAERGFDVTIYERRAWGGKARSTEVPGTGTGGRKDLPGEHGWRTFLGFYQNTVETMKRVPFGSNPNGVFDNLVAATTSSVHGWDGHHDMVAAAGHAIPARHHACVRHRDLLPAHAGTAPFGCRAARFWQCMAIFMSSCDARRIGQWENTNGRSSPT